MGVFRSSLTVLSFCVKTATFTMIMRIARVCSPGHPDRACDLIAESIVDEYLRRDPLSALRIHVSGGRGSLFVSGVASSKADFDVGAIVSRTAASLGVRHHIDPFISIEPVPGSFLLDATRTSHPVGVIGYATRETENRIPAPVHLARKIAKRLEELRQYDAEWFWLEPSFEVTVAEHANGAHEIFVNCVHGEVELADARTRIGDVIHAIDERLRVHVNMFGPIRTGGLDFDIGSSAIPEDPYGSGVPVSTSPIGCDPSHPRKFGAWLARGLARRALERCEAKAVMVHAIYFPGDATPTRLRIRDERGRDIAQDGDATALSYAHLSGSLRPGLSTNAAHWGYAGEVELPWEGGA